MLFRPYDLYCQAVMIISFRNGIKLLKTVSNVSILELRVLMLCEMTDVLSNKNGCFFLQNPSMLNTIVQFSTMNQHTRELSSAQNT